MKRSSLILSFFLLAPAAYSSTITYTASLSGPNESPVNASPGTGFGTVIVDNVANTLNISVNFTGLTGTTTASHIHCCTATALTGTAGVATQTPSFIGFPLGVTSGTYSQTFDLTLASTYNPAFVTANGGSVPASEIALLAGIASGKTYLNIHTSTFGGGEIRGFLTAETPEPASFVTAGLTLLALAPFGRRLLGRRAKA